MNASSTLGVTGASSFSATTTFDKGLMITSSVPSATANTLYNSSGALYWGGDKVVRQNEVYNYVTGWLSGGDITINGADNTKIDITAGSALIVDYSDPTDVGAEVITWGAQTALNPALVNRSKWVGVQSNGSCGANFIYSTGFSATDRRSTAVLGRIWSINGAGSIITNVGDYERPAWGITTAFQDFILAYGSWNVSGNIYSANGANLLLNKSAGSSYRYHAEDTIGSENIHTDAAVLPINLYEYHLQGNSTSTMKTTLDVNHSDDGLGGTITVPNNRFTRQEIYYFPVGGSTHVIYGQTQYTSLASAEEAGVEPLNATNQDILEGAIHRATVIARGNVTNLTTAISGGTAKIITISNGNGVVSGNGNLWSVSSDGAIYYNGGSVGVGTSDPSRAKLTVSGNVSYDNGSYGYLMSNGTVGTSSGAVNTSIYASDRIVAGEFNANSDERVKTGIVPLINALDALKGISIKAYNKLTSTGPAMGEIGVIGQEIEQSFPLALRVSQGEVPDGNGDWKTVDDFHSVNYQTLSMLGLGATQELSDYILGDSGSSLFAKNSIFAGGIVPSLALLSSSTAPIIDDDGEKNFLGKVFDRFALWLADATNGIERIFATEIYAEKICLKNNNGEVVCLTADDIKSLNQ